MQFYCITTACKYIVNEIRVLLTMFYVLLQNYHIYPIPYRIKSILI